MTAEPRDVEEIRADLAALDGRRTSWPTTNRGWMALMSLADDVEPLLAENAELRAQLDAARRWQAKRVVAISQDPTCLKWMHESERMLIEVDAAEARLAAADRENAELRGQLRESDSRFRTAAELLGERTSQLAAAQAQLAEAQEQAYSAETALAAAEARLEAVRALVDEAFRTRQCHVRDECEMHTMVPAAKLRAALSAAPQPEPETLAIDVQHLARQRAWSERTFGPGRRTLGVTDHIRKELKEILDDPDDLKEWVDVVILALDGAWRTDATPAEIIAAIKAKQARNEARTWPDWRTMSPDRAIEHVSEAEPPASDEPARYDAPSRVEPAADKVAITRHTADEPARVPDLMAALRVSVEAAKKRRIAPKDES